MHPSDLSLHLKVVQARPAQARILFKISCPCAPAQLYTATELQAPSGLGPRSSSAASVVFLLSSSSAPWQGGAGLQRGSRYSAGPPTPGPARIFSPTQDLAIATHNPK